MTSDEPSHDHDHAGGSAELYFEHGFGQAISGLTVRVTAGSKSFSGATDAQGFLPTLHLHSPDTPAAHDHGNWVVSAKAPVRVSIEVKKGDGSWKNIGAFNLEDGQRKRVTVSANSTASPMPLALHGAA
ncbi:hypothetical protein [Ralstonia sp. ASV6]|uniref:hypothetical protein n=1 Tax=Ralstonia sp. ASV6 TaxID=2795124 RepID=UPI0018EDB1AA|nr:hypothetical protein [Ralstonia sp. ASV6]